MTNNNNEQQMIGSGFNGKSTTHDVIRNVNLSGKVAIVTGGYAGIGLETTRTFSAAGATVIVPARDMEKAQKNLQGINNVEVHAMDLMDAVSIDQFAKTFLASERPLHLLVNNAGIMWVPLQRDSRGYESQLSTNHLGHFQLTLQLLPALKKANGARVANVSSFGHQMADFNFEDPNFLHRPYETLQGYGHSKTANILFAKEFDHRAKQFGIRSFSLSPGSIIGTDLGRVAPMELLQQMGMHDANGKLQDSVAATLKTLEQGAATTVWCATSKALDNKGGLYCENCDVANIDRGDIEHKYDDMSTLVGVQPYAIDGERAKKLWQLSEQMTGISFNA
jgi:NAD(P)-dependent dehydrogenase (short-subunit alcohol dehydrogenase family)